MLTSACESFSRGGQERWLRLDGLEGPETCSAQSIGQPAPRSRAGTGLVILISLLLPFQWAASSDSPPAEMGGGVAYAEEILADAPWLYYRFEDVSGARIRNWGVLGVAGDGIPSEFGLIAGLFAATGTSGASVWFDGREGSIEIPVLEETARLTIELWLNKFPQPSDLAAVLANHRWETGALHLNLAPAAGGTALEFAISGNPTPYPRLRPDWVAGEWNHLVLTYESSGNAAELNLYLNGAHQSQVVLPGGLPVRWSGARLGMWQTSRAFAGLMNEFALYPTVLSAARIQTHYQMGRQLFGYHSVMQDFDSYRLSESHRMLSRLQREFSPVALQRGIQNLTETFPGEYPMGPEYLERLDVLAARLPDVRERLKRLEETALADAQELLDFKRAALLANPLLDFDSILLVRRHRSDPKLGLPYNWQHNSCLPQRGWDNEIAFLSPVHPQGELQTLYRPEEAVFVGDLELHFAADRLMFTSLGAEGTWQVFELGIDGGGLRQITPDIAPYVDNYDACYLPDGRIIFASTAGIAAVACVNGSSRVANLYLMDPARQQIRQLGFDQETCWHPTVLNDGRILYQRWEYTDTPHAHTRLLFTMNPDGTGQVEYYGSNSYWPNSLFYARPIPGHPSQVIVIVSGHHGVSRKGELVLLDPALGRREASGVVQRIPGFGQEVEPLIEDNLVDNSWPKFLHPYPLNHQYFLVSAQLAPGANWGIYLVDIFDNLLLLKEQEGYVLFEPIPVRARPVPPVIPDRVDLNSREALVYLNDIYDGGGLVNLPRGTIQQLRLLSYNYLYPGVGGPQGVVGIEGPWDIKVILGTVPVEEDGSAFFTVPANTPISLQPLDAEGKAVQLMRSWMTAMPGERVSCVGCHEPQNRAAMVTPTVAARRAPSPIEPWHGPARGFSFAREVQPVLDRYCIGCHDGGDDSPPLDLRGEETITDYTSFYHHGERDAGHFSVSYAGLHRYVRRPGLESDYHLLTPMEYHADSTELMQMLYRGHHQVELDAEALDRLITWIDLNAPYHGRWTDIAGKERVEPWAERRRALARRLANVDVDLEALPPVPARVGDPVIPQPPSPAPRQAVQAEDWPFDPGTAQQRQKAAGRFERFIPLDNGMKISLVRIPGGEFVMGDADGHSADRPRSVVRVNSFWMSPFEITNEQYAWFDPFHDSKVESRHGMQFGVRGFYVNGPQQPVVRVSWNQAMAFCEWLSAQTGQRITLPTEAQWEYACRAGSDTAFYFGALGTDFSRHANLADATLSEFMTHPYKKERDPYTNPGIYDDWIPKDDRFHDGGFISEDVGGYLPNPWGLYDMHGNVAEWTRTVYRPYPYRDQDGRNALAAPERRVVRGGSWRDRPFRATASFRLAYWAYQPVFNVGFRIIVEEPADHAIASESAREPSINAAPERSRPVSMVSN
jgi:formylglycine-generating enzyme required for sulfatase activity